MWNHSAHVLLASLALALSACSTLDFHSQMLDDCPTTTAQLKELHVGAGKTEPCLLTDEDGVPTSPAAYTENFRHERLLTDATARPFLGLALAGGGTKASSAAMGVLAGLNDSGVLQHMDIISSVSGGSYAAYYYFNSLMQIARSNGAIDDLAVEQRFADCVPQLFLYGSVVDGGQRSHFCGFVNPPAEWANHPLNKYVAPEALFSPQSDRLHAEKFGKIDNPQDARDHLIEYAENGGYFAPQMMIRYQPDILSNSFDFPEADSLYSTKLQESINLGILLRGSVVMVPADAISNQLFDWNAGISATSAAYKWGIYNTFGSVPPQCGRGSTRTEKMDPDCNRAYAARSSFSQLRLLRDKANKACSEFIKATTSERAAKSMAHLPSASHAPQPNNCRDIPLWIINSTSGYSESPFYHLENHAPDMVRDVFEISPYGYGSGHYGYFAGLPPFDILTAVLASAAFLDSQQKVLDQPLRSIFGLATITLGANWGVDFKNPRVSDAEVSIHRLLPWPLHLFHRTEANEYSVDIHLSDGGNSDNLGAYALIRRGVKNIVIADSSFDEHGMMADLCHLKSELDWSTTGSGDSAETDKEPALRRDFKIEIYFPDLGDFSKHCKNVEDAMYRDVHGSDYEMGYPVHHWSRPVLEGCAFRLPKPKQNPDTEGPTWTWEDFFQRVEQANLSIGTAPCETFARSSFFNEFIERGGQLWSHLFLLKPALNEKWMCKTPTEFRKMARGLAEQKRVLNLCPSDFPVEVLAYAASVAENVGGALPEPITAAQAKAPLARKCPVFPQHDTKWITMDAESWQYAAYRDLLRYYASQIKIGADQGVPGAQKLEVEQRAQQSGNAMTVQSFSDKESNLSSPYHCRFL